MSLEYLTISQVKKYLEGKQFSCQELTQYYLKRIDSQRELNSYITVSADQALKQAKEIDEKINQGQKLDLLEGVPIAIKDIIMTKGIRTTASSKALSDYVAPYDATVVSKLKETGVVILGKNSCDEFAMGSSNETNAFGPVKNPWDKERVPGGTSGGSTAAVAADLCTASLGTDTGGSVRQPAAFCGVVGLRPTYGRVSRYGLISMTSSLDQASPVTRTVEDAAIFLDAIAGEDRNDFTTLTCEKDNYLSNLNLDIKGKKIGIPKEYFSSGMDIEIETAIKEAIKKFKELGAVIKDVSLPHTVYSLAVYYIIMPAEVSSNLARYDGIRYSYKSQLAKDLFEVYTKSRAEGFGDEVKRRIMMGTYVLSAGYQDAYYKQARKVQKLIQEEYQKIFKQVDVLLTPTTPTTAFKIGEKFNDPLTMYLSDIYTVSVNISGLCGISIPCGFSKKSLPIGLQILGAPFEEAKILQFAYNYQEATNWHNQHPNL